MLKGSKVFTGTVVTDFDGKFCVLKKKGAVPRFVVIDCEESANGLKTLMGKAETMRSRLKTISGG